MTVLPRLMNQATEWSEEDLHAGRQAASEASGYSGATSAIPQLRSAIETIAALRQLNGSIRDLDTTSTKLIKITNRLTLVILIVTIIGLMVAVGQLYLGYKAFLI